MVLTRKHNVHCQDNLLVFSVIQLCNEIMKLLLHLNLMLAIERTQACVILPQSE